MGLVLGFLVLLLIAIFFPKIIGKHEIKDE